MRTPAKIPYPYIRGAELSLIASSKSEVLQGDDGIHQVLTTLRSRIVQNITNPTDVLIVIDRLASQFGEMKVDLPTATLVLRKCGFNPGNLLT